MLAQAARLRLTVRPVIGYFAHEQHGLLDWYRNDEPKSKPFGRTSGRIQIDGERAVAGDPIAAMPRTRFVGHVRRFEHRIDHNEAARAGGCRWEESDYERAIVQERQLPASCPLVEGTATQRVNSSPKSMCSTLLSMASV